MVLDKLSIVTCDSSGTEVFHEGEDAGCGGIQHKRMEVENLNIYWHKPPLRSQLIPQLAAVAYDGEIKDMFERPVQT